MHHIALKFVDAVERFGSIRAAARHLNVASSSITRQIQNLEHSLGVQLFERGNDGVVVTQAGQVVLAHVKRTLRDLERTKIRLEAMAGRRDTLIHIVTVDSVSSSFLPILLTDYLSEQPGVRFKVSVVNSSMVWDRLLEDEADLAINFRPPESAGIRTEARFKLSLGVCCARDHPIAARDEVTLREMLDYPMVALSLSAPIFDEIRRITKEARRDVAPWIETDSSSMIKNLLETGSFISIRTVLFSVGYDLSSLRTVWRPIKEELPFETMIVGTRIGHEPNTPVASFAEYARRFFAKSLG